MADQALFLFREYVQLCLTDGNVQNINLPMIQYNTKVYKGVSNTIDFVVRNNDRTPVNLVGYQIEALIQRISQPELLITKPVYPIDERAGKACLSLDPSDTDNWLAGYYRYTIRLTDVNGKTKYLYTDINRSTFGTFELIEGMSVSLVPAVEVKSENFTPYPYGDYENTWSTGALIGDAQDNQLNGLHTIIVYTNEFHGEFWIQASLSMNAPQETDWFTIPLSCTNYLHSYQHRFPNQYPDQYPHRFYYDRDWCPKLQIFNFTGNYYWVRVMYKTDPRNKGTFNKILYKK